MPDTYETKTQKECRRTLSDNASLCAIGYSLINRSAKCLYITLLEVVAELTWTEFCQTLHHSQDLSTMLCMVTSDYVQQFAVQHSFDFQTVPTQATSLEGLDKLLNNNEPNAMCDMSRECAESIATSLLLCAQYSHYKQRCQLIQCYTMEDYLAELSDESMSQALMQGYINAVLLLDFKDAWKANRDAVLSLLRESHVAIGNAVCS